MRRLSLVAVAARVAAGPPDERVTLSPTPIPSVRDVPQDDSGWKPSGLWYDVNDSWYKAKKHDGFLEYRKYKHAYRLEVDLGKMVVLASKDDVHRFDAQYRVVRKKGDERFGINWSAVKADGFSGVEVNPFLYLSGYQWYMTFDVASGCVWSPDAVVSMEEIPYGDIGGARRDMLSGLRELAARAERATPDGLRKISEQLERDYKDGYSFDYGSFEDWPPEVLDEFKSSAAEILGGAA